MQLPNPLELFQSLVPELLAQYPNIKPKLAKTERLLQISPRDLVDIFFEDAPPNPLTPVYTEEEEEDEDEENEEEVAENQPKTPAVYSDIYCWLDDLQDASRLFNNAIAKAHEDKKELLGEFRDMFNTLYYLAKNSQNFQRKWYNPPATDAALQALQSVLPTPLPLTLLVALRVTNGVKECVYMNDSDLWFASAETMLSLYKRYNEIHQKEKDIQFCLPIFHCNHGAWLLCLQKLEAETDFRGNAIQKGSILNYNEDEGSMYGLKYVKRKYLNFVEITEIWYGQEEL